MSFNPVVCQTPGLYFCDALYSGEHCVRYTGPHLPSQHHICLGVAGFLCLLFLCRDPLYHSETTRGIPDSNALKRSSRLPQTKISRCQKHNTSKVRGVTRGSTHRESTWLPRAYSCAGPAEHSQVQWERHTSKCLH